MKLQVKEIKCKRLEDNLLFKIKFKSGTKKELKVAIDILTKKLKEM